MGVIFSLAQIRDQRLGIVESTTAGYALGTAKCLPLAHIRGFLNP